MKTKIFTDSKKLFLIPLFSVLISASLFISELITGSILVLSIIGGNLNLILTLSYFIHKNTKVMNVTLYAFIFFVIKIIMLLLPIPEIFTLGFVINGTALIIYYIIVFRIKPLKRQINYLTRGKASIITIILIIATIVVSSVALIMWFELLKPDTSEFQEMIPAKNISLLIPLGLGFALINALTEEFVWRGIFWDGLKQSFNCPVIVIIVQALLFGLIHLGGFPKSLVGVVLASVYGLFLGIIRHKSDGIFYPILTHIFADLVIFAIVAYSVIS